MEHCESCNKCVSGFQLHNPLLNKCVGYGNLRVYFFWCFFTFLSLQTFMIWVFTIFWSEVHTPFYLKFWDCVMMLPTHSYFFFACYLFLLVCYVYFLDQLLWMIVALSRWITVHEYKNIYNYKYCFKVKKDKHTNQYVFEHKWFSLFWSLKNLFDILILGQSLSKNSSNNLIISQDS